MAHITRRDNRWRARYPHPTIRNKQIEKTFKRRQDAENWLTNQTHSILTGTHITPEAQNTTFETLATLWLNTQRDLEPKTQAGYKSILNTHLLPAFHNTRLRDLTPARIEAFLSTLTQQDPPISPGTQRNVFAALRTALNTAVRLRLMHSNPTAGIRPPRAARKPMLFLSADEVHRLANHPLLADYRTLIYAAAYTGLRAGELLALRRSDLDLFNNRLAVHRALKEVNGVLSFGPTKTHQSRTVSLPRFLVRMLEAQLDGQPRFLASGGPQTDDLVFAGRNGQPLRHGNFYRRHFRPAVEAALPHKAALRFHDLRHSAASILIEQGAHPKLIQERLGHASITTTLDIYGHLFPSVEEALAEKLDAAFAAAPPSNVVELRL